MVGLPNLMRGVDCGCLLALFVSVAWSQAFELDMLACRGSFKGPVSAQYGICFLRCLAVCYEFTVLLFIVVGFTVK